VQGHITAVRPPIRTTALDRLSRHCSGLGRPFEFAGHPSQKPGQMTDSSKGVKWSGGPSLLERSVVERPLGDVAQKRGFLPSQAIMSHLPALLKLETLAATARLRPARAATAAIAPGSRGTRQQPVTTHTVPARTAAGLERRMLIRLFILQRRHLMRAGASGVYFLDGGLGRDRQQDKQPIPEQSQSARVSAPSCR